MSRASATRLVGHSTFIHDVRKDIALYIRDYLQGDDVKDDAELLLEMSKTIVEYPTMLMLPNAVAEAKRYLDTAVDSVLTVSNTPKEQYSMSWRDIRNHEGKQTYTDYLTYIQTVNLPPFKGSANGVMVINFEREHDQPRFLPFPYAGSTYTAQRMIPSVRTIFKAMNERYLAYSPDEHSLIHRRHTMVMYLSLALLVPE